MGFQEVYAESQFQEFRITGLGASDEGPGSGIPYEDDARETYDQIEVEYKAPAISVDTSGRFTSHEIIGGTTVRQKTGEEPMEVDISGVCLESTAKQLDTLRDAKFGVIHTGRLPGESLTVHFASVSTSPIEDSGAVRLEDAAQGNVAEFLYNYDMSCVEINLPPLSAAEDAGTDTTGSGGNVVPSGGGGGEQNTVSRN